MSRGMTHEQFAAGLNRLGHPEAAHDYLEKSKKLSPYGDDLASYLEIRAGLRGFRPEKDSPNLRELIHKDLSQIQRESQIGVLDFANLVGNAAHKLLSSRFGPHVASVERVCRTIQARDFRPVTFISIGLDEPTVVNDGMPYPRAKPVVAKGATAGKIQTYGHILKLSQPAFSVWGDDLIQLIQDSAQNVYAPLECRRMAEVIESATPTATVTGGMTTTGLGNAAKAMRHSLNNALTRVNHSVSGLVVPSALEIPAMELVEKLNAPWAIFVNCHLTNDANFFAVPSPKVSAPLVRLILGNQNEPLVSGAEVKDGSFGFLIRHEFDYALTGQPSLVKITP